MCRSARASLPRNVSTVSAANEFSVVAPQEGKRHEDPLYIRRTRVVAGRAVPFVQRRENRALPRPRRPLTWVYAPCVRQGCGRRVAPEGGRALRLHVRERTPDTAARERLMKSSLDEIDPTDEGGSK